MNINLNDIHRRKAGPYFNIIPGFEETAHRRYTYTILRSKWKVGILWKEITLCRFLHVVSLYVIYHCVKADYTYFDCYSDQEINLYSTPIYSVLVRLYLWEYWINERRKSK